MALPIYEEKELGKSELGFVSTDTASVDVQKDEQKLNSLDANFIPGTSGYTDLSKLQSGQTFRFGGQTYTKTPEGKITLAETEAPVSAPVKQPEPGKIKYINLDGQTKEISGEGITPETVENLIQQGFYSIESTGDVPSWALTGDIATGRANADLTRVRKEKDDLIAGLSQFMITDAQLNAQIQNITNLYDQRIRDMEDINRRRQGAVSTLGVRIGSRYTGGAGGMFGGIIAEEERQGVGRITELQEKKQQAIIEARNAANNQNWQVYTKKVEAAQKAYDEQLDAVKEFNKTLIENNKKVAEEKAAVAKYDAIVAALPEDLASFDFKTVYDAVAAKGVGATPKEIFDVVKSMREAAGEDFQGVVGEWQDAMRAGAIDETVSLFDFIQKKDPGEALRLKKLGLDIKKLEEELAGTSGDALVGTATGQAISEAVRGLKFSSVADRKDAERSIRDLVADGRIEDAKEELIRYVRNAASPEDVRVLDAKDDSVIHLTEIQRLLNEWRAKGMEVDDILKAMDRLDEEDYESGNATGFITGNIEKLLQKIGKTEDPDLAKIGNAIALAVVDYRRAVSGAAFTESEARAYQAIFPDITKDAQLNMAKIGSIISKFETDRESFAKRRIGPLKYEKIFGSSGGKDELKVNPDTGMTLEEEYEWFNSQLPQDDF